MNPKLKIKKIGHCCLILTINNKRIMTDPGSYTLKEQVEECNLDLIVITHEHPDHLHVESLKKIMENNPNVVVVSNSAVGKILGESGIPHDILEDGGVGEFAGVYLEAHGDKHEEIYEDYGQVQNTGYFIGKDLFYPGDAFTNPGKHVDILALPVAGPWTNIKTPMMYAREIRPRICFPVHDGMLAPNFGTAHKIPTMMLPDHGIEFKALETGKEEEI
jgi:L-ascorbate metabolism protein UlaG (beta-lactamase superfamily)